MDLHISLVLIGPSSIHVEFVLNFEWKRAFFWLPDNCLTTAWRLPLNCPSLGRRFLWLPDKIISVWQLPDKIIPVWRLSYDCLMTARQLHDLTEKNPEFVQSFPEFSLSFPEFSPKKWISVFHWFSLVFWPSSIQVEFVLKQDCKRAFSDCLMVAWWMPDDCLMTAWWLPDDCLMTAWWLSANMA